MAVDDDWVIVCDVIGWPVPGDGRPLEKEVGDAYAECVGEAYDEPEVDVLLSVGTSTAG